MSGDWLFEPGTPTEEPGLGRHEPATHAPVADSGRPVAHQPAGQPEAPARGGEFALGGPPLLILLHGTGGSARDLLPIARFLAPTSPRLALNGPVIEADQRRFFAHLPNGEADPASVAAGLTWLCTTVTQALTTHQRLAAPLVWLGFSNGADLIGQGLLSGVLPGRRALLLHPQALTPNAAATHANAGRPASGHAGGSASTGGVPGSRPGTLAGVRVFASAGRHDPRVSLARFQALTAALTTQGASVTPFIHEQFHNLTTGELQAAQAWLAE